jgi:hypothetical protein
MILFINKVIITDKELQKCINKVLAIIKENKIKIYNKK